MIVVYDVCLLQGGHFDLADRCVWCMFVAGRSLWPGRSLCMMCVCCREVTLSWPIVVYDVCLLQGGRFDLADRCVWCLFVAGRSLWPGRSLCMMYVCCREVTLTWPIVVYDVCLLQGGHFNLADGCVWCMFVAGRSLWPGRWLCMMYVCCREVTLIWPTGCFTALERTGCRPPNTTWLTLKNSFQNSSTCQTCCVTRTASIWVSSVCTVNCNLSFLWHLTYNLIQIYNTINKHLESMYIGRLWEMH